MEIIQIAYKVILTIVCIFTIFSTMKAKSLWDAIGMSVITMPFLLRLLSIK